MALALLATTGTKSTYQLKTGVVSAMSSVGIRSHRTASHAMGLPIPVVGSEPLQLCREYLCRCTLGETCINSRVGLERVELAPRRGGHRADDSTEAAAAQLLGKNVAKDLLVTTQPQVLIDEYDVRWRQHVRTQCSPERNGHEEVHLLARRAEGSTPPVRIHELREEEGEERPAHLVVIEAETEERHRPSARLHGGCAVCHGESGKRHVQRGRALTRSCSHADPEAPVRSSHGLCHSRDGGGRISV
mmetsp:Transcript_35902/g.76633  ORF Transcript_35902/g.76633 Transcript_35902/m.76633 type:complete len:246 (-) Transcript_35902:1126-1863(-)